MSHIFYNTSKLSVSDKINLLEKGKKACFRWWVDYIPLTSMSRKTIKMSFDEVVSKLTKGSLITAIRRDYPDLQTNQFYGEICFSTSDNYFLWVYLDLNSFDEIVKEFNLIQE